MSCPMLGWEERTDETNRVKDRYLALQTDEVDKVKAMLHWKDARSSTADFGRHKQHIIEYINRTDAGGRYCPAMSIVLHCS